jgi:hypothetical protein
MKKIIGLVLAVVLSTGVIFATNSDPYGLGLKYEQESTKIWKGLKIAGELLSPILIIGAVVLGYNAAMKETSIPTSRGSFQERSQRARSALSAYDRSFNS